MFYSKNEMCHMKPIIGSLAYHTRRSTKVLWNTPFQEPVINPRFNLQTKNQVFKQVLNEVLEFCGAEPNVTGFS